MDRSQNDFIIGVVGPCAAGKTTLIARLERLGISARHIAQEHSYVEDMWQRLTNPDVLVYLDVSYQVSQHRRNLDMSPDDFAEQQRRLRHALQHADLYLYTDDMTPEDVVQAVLTLIDEQSKSPE